jgi:uncharacterized glyoxalase superfamily protein PhnB
MTSPITPAVSYRDPMAAMRWLEAAFGFETSLVVTDRDGNFGHGQMTFGEGQIDIGGEWSSPELLGPASMKSPASLGGVGTQFLRIELPSGLDEHCARARAAGAQITQAPEEQFYGSRTYRALDPEGHVWNFSELSKAVSWEEMQQASGLTFADRLPQ